MQRSTFQSATVQRKLEKNHIVMLNKTFSNVLKKKKKKRKKKERFWKRKHK